MADRPWADQAACKDKTVLFFRTDPVSVRDAKRICGRCPVEEECLDYALAKPEAYGVWGGKSERERNKMRRKSRRSVSAGV